MQPSSRCCCRTAGFVVVIIGFAIPTIAEDRPSTIVLSDCRVTLVKEVVLAADRTGIIADIPFREGDVVDDGVILAQLRDDGPHAAFLIAQKEANSDIEIRFAEKVAQVASLEHERAVEANQRLNGTFTEVELYKLKAAAEKAALETELARFKKELQGMKLVQARSDWEALRVTAPFSGVITRVHRRRGEAVRQGDPIIELISTRTLRVEAYLGLNDAWRVRHGMPVSVQLDQGKLPPDIAKRVFMGQIVFVDLKAQAVTGGVRVWAEIDNPDGLLRAGLTARMTISEAMTPLPSN